MLPERSLIILLLRRTLNLPHRFLRHRSDKNANGFLSTRGPEIKSCRMWPLKKTQKSSSRLFIGYIITQNYIRSSQKLTTCVSFQLKFRMNVKFLTWKWNLCLSNYIESVSVRSAVKMIHSVRDFFALGGRAVSSCRDTRLSRDAAPRHATLPQTHAGG